MKNISKKVNILIFFSLFVLFYGCNKSKQAEPSEENSIDEEFTDIYLEACDDGQWVERVLQTAEDERIAEMITELDNINGDIASSEKKSADVVQADIVSKDNDLLYMKFGDELFIPSKADENFVTVTSDGKTVLRNYYDTDYKLIKKETWAFVADKKIKILRTEKFTYSEESGKLKSSVLVTDNSKEKKIFSEEGLLQERKFYSQVAGKYHIVSEQFFKYNSENRITVNKTVEYTYSDSKFTKVKDTFVKKTVFMYNEDDIPPDEEYFENDQIKMKKKYGKNKGTYTTEIFFDNNYSVKTYFEDENRIKEVYTADGKIWREKTYEQK